MPNIAELFAGRHAKQTTIYVFCAFEKSRDITNVNKMVISNKYYVLNAMSNPSPIFYGKGIKLHLPTVEQE